MLNSRFALEHSYYRDGEDEETKETLKERAIEAKKKWKRLSGSSLQLSPAHRNRKEPVLCDGDEEERNNDELGSVVSMVRGVRARSARIQTVALSHFITRISLISYITLEHQHSKTNTRKPTLEHRYYSRMCFERSRIPRFFSI